MKNKDTIEIRNAGNSEKIEIRNTVNRVYENLTLDSTRQPNLETIKNQFAERAVLGYMHDDSLVLHEAGQYFDAMRDMLSEGGFTYIREWEVSGKTSQFGNIAQHTSLYENAINTTDSITERGIAHYQLVKLDDSWKILSMIWQAADEEHAVPEKAFE